MNRTGSRTVLEAIFVKASSYYWRLSHRVLSHAGLMLELTMPALASQQATELTDRQVQRDCLGQLSNIRSSRPWPFRSFVESHDDHSIAQQGKEHMPVS